MATEWTLTRVGQLADSISVTHNFGKDELIFLNTSDILLGEILHNTYSAVCDWPGQAKKSIRRDDILFSEIRPANGRWAYVNIDAEDFVVSTKLMVIRSRRDHVVPRFLYHFLTSKQTTNWLQHLAESRSGTFPQITFDQVAELKLLLPPLGTQTAIANFLDSLDDKIELNRRMSATLETFAHALFKSWFVDFDPVRAKAEGRQPAGLNAETAELFPKGFEDSELGEIPRGWRVGPMPESFNINPPRTIAKDAPAPYLEMSNMPTTSARVLGWEYRDVGSGMRFINGDVLVARITPCLENGKTTYVDFLPDGQTGWGSTEYIVIRSKAPMPPAYAYFLARSDDFRQHAIQNMTGTSGRQRVPTSAFDSYLVVVPPSEIGQLFGAFASRIFATIKAHDEESQTLAAIRDALLPKLLSGEMQIKAAEQVAAEVRV